MVCMCKNIVSALCVCACVCIIVHLHTTFYGVATDSRIDEIIGLFCRISSLL